MSFYLQEISTKISINLFYCTLAIGSLVLSGCQQEDNGFPIEEGFSPPTTSQLLISPEAQVNIASTASYQFNDAANRQEGQSKIHWYIDNELLSSDAQFTPTKQHEGQWLYFCVTPVSAYGNNDAGVKNCSTMEIILAALGSAPIANNVMMSTPLYPEINVKGSYDYVDNDEDLEGDSLLIWKLNGVEVSQGNNYTLPSDSQGVQLSFCVTPISLTGDPKVGVEVCDIKTINPIYTSPTAVNLLISPSPLTNTLLTGSYLFLDANNRPEGASKLSWKLNDIDIDDETSSTITLSVNDEGKTFSFCVIPIASLGENSVGSKVCSTPIIVLPKDGSPPVANNLSLSSPLTPGQSVTAYYLYSDADGDSEAISITQWFIDGVDSGSGLNLTLPLDSESKTLMFCVTPIAQTGSPKQGTKVCLSEPIIGAYIAPTAANLLITPSPIANTLLSGSYLFLDANNRPEGASKLSWKLNDIDNETSSTITLSAIDEGKTLSFCVIPIAAFGGNSVGSKVCSTPIIVLPKDGSPPVANNLSLSSPLTPGQSVTAYYLYSDADGDSEAISITQWFIDGVDSGSGLNLTLPLDSESKTLMLCVTPIAQTGSPKQGTKVCLSEPIIGAYIVPTATNLQKTPTPVVGSLLTGTYVFYDANSRLEGNSELSWKVDGIEIATGSSITLTKNNEGKNISFCVIPIAISGQNARGIQVCTSPVNINPELGSAPSATNLSWDAFPKPGTFLTVSYDFSDPDGDAEGISLFSWKLNSVEVSQDISYTPPTDSGGKTLEYCISPVALTGTPKIGNETCITTDIAAILLSGALQFDQILTLEIKGYTNLGVTWRSTNPSSNHSRSTSATSFTITRETPTESAFVFIGYDIEVCVDTTEEGQLCSLASSYDVSKVTGGLPMAIDAGFAITQRGVAPIPYIDLTIGLITKRLHRPITIIESQILNNIQPAVPLFDSQRSENGTSVFWAVFTWPNANTQCIERSYSLTVDGVNDTSDLFGLKQFYDEIITLYPGFAVSHVSSALGWGTDIDYYWSISDVGGGSHADFYMVSGALGSIADTTPEYAACIEILP